MHEKLELSFAKQRFDTSAQPLARCVWKIATCQRLGLQRLSQQMLSPPDCDSLGHDGGCN